MAQANDKQNTPTSLFIMIRGWDSMIRAEIKETSDDTTRRHIERELQKAESNDYIPDTTIIEFRFPNMEAIPPPDKDLRNEFYSSDVYSTIKGMSVPRQTRRLRVAAFLAKNNIDVLQTEDFYRQVNRSHEYREFSYMNDRDLFRYPGRLDKYDVEFLEASRVAGGPVLSDILLARYGSEKPAEPPMSAEKRSVARIGIPPVRRNKPPISAKRPGIPKRAKGRSL